MEPDRRWSRSGRKAYVRLIGSALPATSLVTSCYVRWRLWLEVAHIVVANKKRNPEIRVPANIWFLIPASMDIEYCQHFLHVLDNI